MSLQFFLLTQEPLVCYQLNHPLILKSQINFEEQSLKSLTNHYNKKSYFYNPTKYHPDVLIDIDLYHL